MLTRIKESTDVYDTYLVKAFHARAYVA